MNIDSKADFAGQPMLLVRDLVREIHRRDDGAFDADDWAYVFAAGRADDRDRVLAELAARGHVRRAGAAENEELPFRARVAMARCGCSRSWETN